MSANNDSPEDGFLNLLQQLRTGRVTIDDFLRMLEIEKWLRIFCYRYNFKSFGGVYGPQDLYWESFEKVLKFAPTLKPENTPNERAFRGWLKTLVSTTFLDALRKLNKLQSSGQERSDEPAHLLNLHAPEVDFNGKYFLRRFFEFIEPYPVAHRRAAEEWLADCSYREIAETLNDEGLSDCSHVTVRNWVEAMLKAFKEDLGEPPPPKKLKR